VYRGTSIQLFNSNDLTRVRCAYEGIALVVCEVGGQPCRKRGAEALDVALARKVKELRSAYHESMNFVDEGSGCCRGRGRSVLWSASGSARSSGIAHDGAGTDLPGVGCRFRRERRRHRRCVGGHVESVLVLCWCLLRRTKNKGDWGPASGKWWCPSCGGP
jgi:hypothetical protein